MHRQDIAALLLTTEPEIRYFSGFLTQFWQSPTRPWFMVVPLTGRPIAVIPRIGTHLMANTWIEDIRTWPSPSPDNDGISVLLSALRQVAGRTGRVGTLMGPETHLRMPLASFDKMRKALVAYGHELVDATPIIRSLRLVKSSGEIEKIAHICSLVSDAFASLPTAIDPGESEREVFHKLKIDILYRGADDVPYLVGGVGPDGYADIISPPSDSVIQPGDILMLDTGSVFDGYFCDFDRNFAIGRASDAAKQAHENLFRATGAGLDSARPGKTCANVFNSMWRELEDEVVSGNASGRFGHGLGMQLTEWPSISPTDQTVLRPGMILTLEPWIEFGSGRMMVHEENIVIRESGAELLTKRAPRELPVVS